MKTIVICDLDGTLTDPSHRRCYVDGSQPKNWDLFYDLCHMDAVHQDIEHLVDLLDNQGFHIVYVTGRVERVRDKTTSWLRNHDMPHGPVFMRPDGDHREDYVLKREIAERMGLTARNVFLALDDRDQVVNMWRSIGIRCLQVAEGNF